VPEQPAVQDETVQFSPGRFSRAASRMRDRQPRWLRRLTGPRMRRVAVALALVGLTVLAIVQLTRPRSSPGPLVPTAPLVADACRTGDCRIESARDADLAHIRGVLSPDYTVTGLRMFDPIGALRQIQFVATDGLGVLTITAAQNDVVPKGWSLPGNLIDRDGLGSTVVRSVVVSDTGQRRWLVEVRALGPVGSQVLTAASNVIANSDLLS
jgi:hypothetical protein